MLFEQGVQAQKSGRLSEAEAIYRRIIANDPRNFDALHMLAIVCSEQGKIEEAEHTFKKAAAIDQKFPPFFHNFGLHYSRQKQYVKAVLQFDKALALYPNFPPVLSDRGCALVEMGRLKESIESHNKAVALAPNVPKAYFNRAVAHSKLRDHSSALRDYDAALALNPIYDEAWQGRGNALYDLMRYGEAVNAFERASQLDPSLTDAIFLEGCIRLLLGDTAQGWPKYEARWNLPGRSGDRRNFSQPLWLGAGDLKNKTILLHAEQGFGDTLMMCRYVPMVAALGAKVILEVQPALVSIAQDIEGASQVISRGSEIPHFDTHCPIMSLPLAFNTSMDKIPSKVPYLKLREDGLAYWRSRVGNDGFRIGLAWAGNPAFEKDDVRSVLLSNILQVSKIEGAKYFGLQKDLREGDQKLLHDNPQIVHLGSEVKDFEETAAIMSSLDLIISSDTSIVHLAGALGRPTWVLLTSNPDWRWYLERSDSPWYPSAKLFRQSHEGEWRPVIDEVCAALRNTIASQRQ